MQRKIKFRGFNKKNNKWLYGDLLRVYGISYIINRSINPFCLISPDVIDDIRVDPNTIGQYTGIDLVQEKNGMNVWVTEIYEGDLIANSDGVVSKVIYYDGAYRLQSIRQAALLDKEFINVLKYKVVGNIYENPKLMTHKYTKK